MTRRFSLCRLEKVTFLEILAIVRETPCATFDGDLRRAIQKGGVAGFSEQSAHNERMAPRAHVKLALAYDCNKLNPKHFCGY